jgi:hypothetical protein
MQADFTLSQMANIELPLSRKDPLSSQQFPSFHFNSKVNEFQFKESPKHKYTESPAEIKLVPATHYIETRFNAYSKAKAFNRPLFTHLNKAAESSNCSIFNSRYQTSRYPKVPLSKELSQKVETVNSFREIVKKPSKGIVIVRPSSNNSIIRKPTKSKEFLSNYKFWEKIKREKSSTVQKQREVKPKTRASSTIKKRGFKKDFFNTCESNSSQLGSFNVYGSASNVSVSPYFSIAHYENYADLIK